MKYLTMEDIEKFKQDGFLVKKKFLMKMKFQKLENGFMNTPQKNQKIGRKDKKWDITKLAWIMEKEF